MHIAWPIIVCEREREKHMKLQTTQSHHSGDWLWLIIDVGHNLQKALETAARIDGIAALLMCMACIVFCCGLTIPIYWFDLDSTQRFFSDAFGSLKIPQLGLYFGIASFGLLFVSTIAELFMVRLAMAGIFMVRLLIGFAFSFDMITDFMRVTQTIQHFSVYFALLGVFQSVAQWILTGLLLLLAVVGFEQLFIIACVCSIRFGWQAWRDLHV
jgi:hypothetical protein